MGTSLSERVQKHRDRLRAAGMRLVQIWVPDTRRETFAMECQRQSRLLKNDAHEAQSLDWWVIEWVRLLTPKGGNEARGSGNHRAAG